MNDKFLPLLTDFRIQKESQLESLEKWGKN